MDAYVTSLRAPDTNMSVRMSVEARDYEVVKMLLEGMDYIGGG